MSANLIPTRRSLFGLLAGACAVPYFTGPVEGAISGEWILLNPPPLVAFDPYREIEAANILNNSFTNLLRPGVTVWFAENHDPNAYDGIFPDA